MTKDTVIDANCWVRYVHDQLNGTKGDGFTVFENAKQIGSILFDDGEKIIHEYKAAYSKFGVEIFNDFFEKGKMSNKINLIPAKADQNLGKKLGELGVPKDDHIYFRTAVSGAASYLISEDMDFFNPKLKNAKSDVRIAAKIGGHAPVPRVFRREYNIEICCIEAFLDCEPYISTPPPPLAPTPS